MAKNDNVGIRVGILHASATKSIKQLDKETKNYGKTLKEVFNKSKLIGFITLIKDVTDTMIMASKPQTEYIENLNLMNTAYGSLNNSGGKLIKQLNDIFGLDPSNLTKSLGTFRQLSSALNLTNDIAETLSENLLKMQLDVASLYNLDLDTASKKIISAITGESRAVKVLGADLTQAGLQQTAYNMGISKSVKTMTQAEKTILRYITLQNQLKNSQGDFAKTINSVSNQTKIFREQISMLIRQLGGVFIPILKTILPLLNGILMAVNTIIGALMSLIGIDAENLAKEFGVGAGAIDNITNSLDSVNEASKNAKKSLRGFDKLNVISTPSDNSSGFGGGVSQEMLDAIKEYDMMMSDIQSKATQIKESILHFLGFGKDEEGNWKFVKVTFGTIFGTLLGFGVIGGIFYTVYKTFKKVFGFFKQTKDIKKTAESLEDTGKAITSVKDGFNSLLKNIGKSVVIITILGGIALVIHEITGLIDALSKSGMDATEMFKSFGIIVGSIVVLITALTVAAKLLQSPLAMAGLILITASISAILLVIAETLPSILGAIGDFINKVAIPLSIILDSIKSLIVTILNEIINFINRVGPAVNRFVDNIIGAITKVINFMISGIEYMINTLIIGAINGMIKAINKVIPILDLGTVKKVSISRFRPNLYEHGGFPKKGEFFIANEKSAEMVGSINGRPAVANNDQIVQAISVGVAKAMMSVGNNSNVNVTIEANGDTSGLLNFIDFKQKQRDRQYGL